MSNAILSALNAPRRWVRRMYDWTMHWADTPQSLVALIEVEGFEASDLVKVRIMVSGEEVDALSFLCHKDQSESRGRKILKHNTFEAKSGQMIGICGPTGAGKSTIINILTRYYDIDSGRILIDEQELGSLTQASLRQQIGTVLQEAFLFSDTVMNNLRYAREGATDGDCIEADEFDLDGDGFDAEVVGGTDCDDTDPLVSPGALERTCNDIDDDCDGLTDEEDACPDDPLKTEAGDCGCGIADTDTDNDGTPDCSNKGSPAPRCRNT